MTTPITVPTRTDTPTPSLSFPGVVKSEWIKLHSLRSTASSYAVLVVVTVSLAALIAVTTEVGTYSAAEQVQTTVGAATFGVFFGQLIVAVLGVLAITGEYSTGQIRSTLTAVPGRLAALGAKALVLFVSSFAVGLLSVVLGYLAALPLLAAQGVSASLVNPDVALPLAGSALYLAVIAVFSLGIGTALRSTAGGVALALAVLLLLPLVFALVPVPAVNEASVFLLTNAGLAISGGPSTLDTWQQVLVVAAWVVASTGIGATLLARRDA